MKMMATLKAVVRGGRAVLVEDRVDYPDGTELRLDVRDAADDLDAEELAELDSALEAGQRDYAATEKASSVEDVLNRLRSAR
jgi:hypothetical protein